MKISIVIPAYNESQNIGPTIQETTAALLSLQEEPSLLYEILVIDDCSSDNTFDVVKNLNDQHVRAIRLSRRSGSHIALRAGLNAATGDVTICLAADGQDDPNTLSGMLTSWKGGNEVVWALRRNRQNEPLMQRLFASFFYHLLASFGGDHNKNIDLSRADFYLLDRKVVNAIKSCNERNTSLFGLIAWLGFRQSFVEYDRKPRRAGMSKWSFRNRLRLAKDWIIAFSGLPLKMMTIVGFVIAGLGFLYALYVIINSALYGSPLVGWSSVMTAILVLGGGQIAMLGIIGEYLWRTLDESRNRPTYFIAQDTYQDVTVPQMSRRRLDVK